MGTRYRPQQHTARSARLVGVAVSSFVPPPPSARPAPTLRQNRQPRGRVRHCDMARRFASRTKRRLIVPAVLAVSMVTAVTALATTSTGCTDGDPPPVDA